MNYNVVHKQLKNWKLLYNLQAWVATTSFPGSFLSPPFGVGRRKTLETKYILKPYVTIRLLKIS